MDLSIRLGAMLGFNALMITVGTHPISASPGAPLSLDAATQPVQVIACCLALLPLVISCTLCLRAILLGEDFDSEGLEDGDALRQRLFAAFIRSIDVQHHNLRAAIYWTLTGGALTIAVWVWIMGAKMVG